MSVIVGARAYRDEAGNQPLPRLIGPFDTVEDAKAYMDSLGPLWGVWDTSPIFTPSPPARVPPRLWCHARHFCHHWFEDRCSEACDRGEHDGGHGHEGCADDWCLLPPSGWWCSLKAGHEGPCPTRRLREGIAP